MSRAAKQTKLLCPLCGEVLIMDISGEFDIVDHEYGSFDDGMADGYSCSNEHTIFIKTSDEKDNNHYD